MIDSFCYQEMDYPLSETILELAIKAAVADTQEEMMIPVLVGLLDAYEGAVRFEEEMEELKEEPPERKVLFMKDTQKAKDLFHHTFTLSFGRRDCSDWPDSLPEKGVLYPSEFIQTVARVLAQRQAFRQKEVLRLRQEREDATTKI